MYVISLKYSENEVNVDKRRISVHLCCEFCSEPVWLGVLQVHPGVGIPLRNPYMINTHIITNAINCKSTCLQLWPKTEGRYEWCTSWSLEALYEVDPVGNLLPASEFIRYRDTGHRLEVFLCLLKPKHIALLINNTFHLRIVLILNQVTYLTQNLLVQVRSPSPWESAPACIKFSKQNTENSKRNHELTIPSFKDDTAQPSIWPNIITVLLHKHVPLTRTVFFLQLPPS